MQKNAFKYIRRLTHFMNEIDILTFAQLIYFNWIMPKDIFIVTEL